MKAPGPVLGAVPDSQGTSFAVSSTGSAVDLCLLDDEGSETRVPLASRTYDVWHCHLAGVGHGQRYGFRVDGPWNPAKGHRFDHGALLADPYARGMAGAWSVVVDDGFTWGADRPPLVPWADTVVYELHVRGFTMLHPGVPEPLRGTYAGLAHPDVVAHLVDLGVTTVELMPVHEFRSEPALAHRGLVNYWGYNSVGFFAPHGAYSSSGNRGQQVSEFKAMVRDLHRAGLEVVLDVVYNHTAEGGAGGPTLCWRGLDDGGYYRLREDGSYDDVTGCGNSLDLRGHRCLQMVTDSLRYWVQEMHVDGFRFDLAPALGRGHSGFDRDGAFFAALHEDPVLSRVKLVAEPWDLGEGGYRLGGFPVPWAEWNDRYRDTVRAAWLGSRGSQHGGDIRALADRLAGSPDVFCDRAPLASVSFVTAHDGFTLHDLVSYERKHNEANGEDNRDGTDNNISWACGVEGPTEDPEVLALRRRLMRGLLATLLLSAGVPMLTAGDETGRTQHGNNNAYCLDDATSWVSWAHVAWQRDLYDWTRALLALRREHAALRPGTAVGRTWFGADGDDGRVLGMRLAGIGGIGGIGGPVDDVLVLLNTGPCGADVALPEPGPGCTYSVLLDTADEQPRPGGRSEGMTQLGPYTVRVLLAGRVDR